jgi:hypothetical protein
MAKSKKSKGAGRQTSLAAFFRKLWSNKKLLARFSEGAAGREEVLQQFNLSARNKRLLIGGCMRDIIGELAGVGGKAGLITIANAVADLSCGHPECEAFVKAAKKR